MITAMLATGDIKTYQIIVGGMNLMGFPISWILLKNGMPPEATFLCLIFISSFCLLLRLVLLKRMIKLPVKQFVIDVLCKVLLVVVLSSIMPYLITCNLPTGLYRLFVNCVISFILTIGIILFIGINNEERHFIFNKISLHLKIRR
jgi:hypothetical protein